MKTEKYDVSFCLPVYNVSPFVKRCLDSIIKAEGISYEIICVDDCSKDNSAEEIESFINDNKDYNIRLIRLEKNSGVSVARNTALENAEGRYIWFVDPDDMIVGESVKYHVKTADEYNLDATFSNFECVNGDATCKSRSFNPDYVLIENSYADPNFSKIWPQCDNITFQSIWSGLYRKSFLDEHNIRFSEGIIYCQDFVFNYQYQVYFNKMAKFEDACYLYRHNSNSVSHSVSVEKEKRKYVSSSKMSEIYEGFLKNGIYNSSESKRLGDEYSLKIKINQVKQNTVNFLASTGDVKYIKEQLKVLRKKGQYPYPFIKETLEGSGLRGKLFYLLPIELFVWILMIAYKIDRKNKK